MACPRWQRSSCAHASGSPAAIAICARTEIDAGDLLGHRVLHLQPRVHLEEVEPRRVAGSLHEELHGPRVAVPAVRATATAASPMRWRSAGRERQRRTLLNHFLVAPLDRALTLEQVDDVTVMIGQHLEFDVARLLDQSFHVERAIAEGGHRFPPGLGDRRDEGLLRRGPSSSRCRRHPRTA